MPTYLLSPMDVTSEVLEDQVQPSSVASGVAGGGRSDGDHGAGGGTTGRRRCCHRPAKFVGGRSEAGWRLLPGVVEDVR